MPHHGWNVLCVLLLHLQNMNFLPNPAGFCGALSAFSGTIGDIADVQFGCATEDSMLDVPEKRTTKAGKASQHLGTTRFPMPSVVWGWSFMDTC